jgi:hypothetical protein
MSHRGVREIALLASILIIVCIFLPACLSACGVEKGPSIYNIHTIDKLQEEVPFTIILPTYLPTDIGPDPYMVQGPFKRGEETLLIKIEYQKQGGGSGYVYIEEKNSLFYANADWALHPERTYLDIAGIKVQEEITEVVPYPPNEPIDYGFRYVWNKNGTDFLVDIFRYDQDECRKIVESMIQPIE